MPLEDETVLARVVEAPRYPRVGEVAFNADIFSISKKRAEGFAPFRARCKAVDLPWRNSTSISNGAMVLLRGKFTLIEKTVSPFSFSSTLRRQGITAQCKVQLSSVIEAPPPDLKGRIQRFIRHRIEQVLGDGERAGLVLSMGLGVRDVISERTEWGFKATGLAHLLVVSGCQVTLMFGAIWWMLRAVVGVIPPLYHYSFAHVSVGWLACVATGFFIYMVGIEGSTLRAGLALLFWLVALQFERQGGMLNAILVSATVISILWPGAVFEPGVQLTYAALGGILLGKSRQRGWREFLVVSLLATAATGVVAVLWFGTFSPFGFLLNPWLAPLLGFVSCQGGGLAAGLYLAGIDSAGYLLRGVAWVLEQGRDIVVWCAELPWAQWEPQGWWSIAFVAMAIGLPLARRFICRFNQWAIAAGVD
jgi:ComEC/Rec2-related protein